MKAKREYALLLALHLWGWGCGDDIETTSGDAGAVPEGGAFRDASSAPDVGSPDVGSHPDGGGLPPTGWSPLSWEDCEGSGRTLEAGPEDYRDAVSTLRPGDILRLRPGVYPRGLRLDASGEPGRCIVVEALDPTDPPTIHHGGSNTIDLVGASWVKLRNLLVDSEEDAGYFGVALKTEGGLSHHVVIEGCHFVGQGGSQQTVAISTKAPALDWVIRGNLVEGAGTGLYLGNSNGREPFVRGLIEFNAVVDPLGYAMQIKHQVAGSRDTIPADLLGSEPSRTVIRFNVFAKRRTEPGDSGARPNLLLGHLPPSNEDEYLVYGNLFYDNPTERLMQAEGNLRIYHNLFVNPHGDALSVQRHNDRPRRVDVLFNTVVARGLGIGISGGADGFEQVARFNAVFAATPLRIDSGREEGNATGSTTMASEVLHAPDASPDDGLDLHPAPGALSATVDLAALPDLPEARTDFDGRPRTGAYAGAYTGPAGPNAVPLSLRPRMPGE